jgi:hypothetical protein
VGQLGRNTSASPGRERDGADSINEGLRGIHLGSPRPASQPSSMNMAGLRNALEDSPGGIPRTPTRSRSPLLRPSSAGVGRDSLSPEPSPSPGRRRRSSSQVNQMPHDVRDEEPPQDRFHEPEFQRAFADAKSLVASLARVLERHGSDPEQDSPIRDLHRRAKELAQFRCPPTRTVGLVGDSGVGASPPPLSSGWKSMV